MRQLLFASVFGAGEDTEVACVRISEVADALQTRRSLIILTSREAGMVMVMMMIDSALEESRTDLWPIQEGIAC